MSESSRNFFLGGPLNNKLDNLLGGIWPEGNSTNLFVKAVVCLFKMVKGYLTLITNIVVLSLFSTTSVVVFCLSDEEPTDEEKEEEASRPDKGKGKAEPEPEEAPRIDKGKGRATEPEEAPRIDKGKGRATEPEEDTRDSDSMGSNTSSEILSDLNSADFEDGADINRTLRKAEILDTEKLLPRKDYTPVRVDPRVPEVGEAGSSNWWHGADAPIKSSKVRTSSKRKDYSVDEQETKRARFDTDSEYAESLQKEEIEKFLREEEERKQLEEGNINSEAANNKVYREVMDKKSSGFTQDAIDSDYQGSDIGSSYLSSFQSKDFEEGADQEHNSRKQKVLDIEDKLPRKDYNQVASTNPAELDNQEPPKEDSNNSSNEGDNQEPPKEDSNNSSNEGDNQEPPKEDSNNSSKKDSNNGDPYDDFFDDTGPSIFDMGGD